MNFATLRSAGLNTLIGTKTPHIKLIARDRIFVTMVSVFCWILKDVIRDVIEHPTSMAIKLFAR